MRHALVAYGVVVVVLTMLAREFEAAGWIGVGALDVAAALVNSLLVVAVAAGALLAGRLGLDRWARSMRDWRREQARAEGEPWTDAEVIGVTSWRRTPQPPPSPPAPPDPAIRSAQPPSAGFTYVGPSYGRELPAAPPFPERRGRQI